MREAYENLISYVETHPVINTHSHHLQDSSFHSFSLDALLRKSYVGWCGVPFGQDHKSREAFLEKVRYNSYFVWLQKAIQSIYDMQDPITADNWDSVSHFIQEAHCNTDFHLNIFKEQCKYERILLDAYWQPGSDNGHSDLFAPSFRINMFLYGYNQTARDHNGNNPGRIYNVHIRDLDEYIQFVREAIQTEKNKGAVSLKSALAYDRDLCFRETAKEKAQKVFGIHGRDPSREDIRAFQDYVFFKICEIAAELDMPLQCHTGLGQLQDTNAMAMREVIEKNPDTRFVLFHCGYPWLDDVNGLLHVYPNVYPDLCWLPLISTSAAKRMLHELLEVGTLDKICWGCDTWTSEESYGALLAARHVIASVLSEKTEDGYLTMNDAQKIAHSILYGNAARLYKLD